MPIVRIDLIQGKSEEYRAQVGEIVYQTLVDVLNAQSWARIAMSNCLLRTERTKAERLSFRSRTRKQPSIRYYFRPRKSLLKLTTFYADPSS